MRGLKAVASLTRRSVSSLGFLSSERSLSTSLSRSSADDQLQNEVTNLASPLSFSLPFSFLYIDFVVTIDIAGFTFQVLVEGMAGARAAVLNRPSFLNTLSTNMVLLRFA